MDPAGLAALLDAIHQQHGCQARWVESVPVLETLKGAVVWDGEVQVLEVTAHPTAQGCYAWSRASTGRGRGITRRFCALLHGSRVDSPLAAVRAAIAEDQRALRIRQN